MFELSKESKSDLLKFEDVIAGRSEIVVIRDKDEAPMANNHSEAFSADTDERNKSFYAFLSSLLSLSCQKPPGTIIEMYKVISIPSMKSFVTPL